VKVDLLGRMAVNLSFRHSDAPKYCNELSPSHHGESELR
jgi:hypothetical protein